jgi:hypothetical protein
LWLTPPGRPSPPPTLAKEGQVQGLWDEEG